MDAAQLDFPDASFDAVLCGFALWFFPQPARALQEWFRVLKPGGRIGLTTWAENCPCVNWQREALRPSNRPPSACSKELHIPVIALSQLNRDVEAERPPIPKLSNLRDSGAVEQDADIVIFIYRGDIYEPHTDNGVAQLLIAKQRNGPTGRVNLRFSPTFARFDELAEAYHERLAQGVR
jgi:SAM-dependent methyltransferase